MRKACNTRRNVTAPEVRDTRFPVWDTVPVLLTKLIGHKECFVDGLFCGRIYCNYVKTGNIAKRKFAIGCFPIQKFVVGFPVPID